MELNSNYFIMFTIDWHEKSWKVLILDFKKVLLLVLVLKKSLVYITGLGVIYII